MSFVDWIDYRRYKQGLQAKNDKQTKIVTEQNGDVQKAEAREEQRGRTTEQNGNHSSEAAINQTGAAQTTNAEQASNGEVEKMGEDNSPVRLFTFRVFAMAMIVRIGGMIFGFLEMKDFLRRFGNTTDGSGSPAFSDARSGTIVGLLSIGTLIGAICAAPIADAFGRRVTIVVGNIVFCVGVIVQIATTTIWYQIALGRWVAGLGVGMLSILTPMYQFETTPRQVRGALVGAYQLFITLGIFVAYRVCVALELDRQSHC